MMEVGCSSGLERVRGGHAERERVAEGVTCTNARQMRRLLLARGTVSSVARTQ